MSFNRSYLKMIKTKFVKVPVQVLDVGLSPKAIAVYLFLANSSENFHPSNRFMAARLQVDKNTVNRAIHELLAKNLITASTVTTRPGRTRCVYTFVEHQHWRIKDDPAADS